MNNIGEFAQGLQRLRHKFGSEAEADIIRDHCSPSIP